LEGPIVHLDHLRLRVPDPKAAETDLEELGFHVHRLDSADWRAVVLPFAHLELEADGVEGLVAIGLAGRTGRGGGGASEAAVPTRRVDAALAFAECEAGIAGLPLAFSRTLAPEALRPAAALRHGNGAVGLASVTCVVSAPVALAPKLAAMLGESLVTRTDDVIAVRLDRTVLLLATAADAELLHPDLASRASAAPALVAIDVTVDDLARVEAVLAAAGRPARRRADGSLGASVPALGLRVAFHAAA